MKVLNLTAELERLVADVVERVEEFRHVDPARLLICITGTRGGGIHGLYAKIHPLRFADGACTRRIRRGRRTVTCSMPSISHRGNEILYMLYFVHPRFFDLSMKEKLVTVFHELFHISPEFNGDIRRFPGRNYAHGSSTKRYNAYMATLVDAYLAGLGGAPLPAFLNRTTAQLRPEYQVLVARRMQAPRMRITTA